jgi:hypothetical protein
MPDSRVPFSFTQRSAGFRVVVALCLSAAIWAGVLMVLS